MSRFFLSSKRTRNTTAFRGGEKFLSLCVRVRIPIFIVTILSLGVYIVQMNSFSTKGLTLRRLEITVKEFERDSRELELLTATLESGDAVATRIGRMGFVAEGAVEYAQPGATIVARR